MNRNQKLFGVSLLALIVSGCAITSEPIERSVSEQRARTDLHNMYKDQEPLNGPLTLHQAMARAVKYNLEGRLKIMEEALAQHQVVGNRRHHTRHVRGVALHRQKAAGVDGTGHEGQQRAQLPQQRVGRARSAAAAWSPPSQARVRVTRGPLSARWKRTVSSSPSP